MGELPNATFGEIVVEPGEIWVESPFDGILGLAYPQIAMPPSKNNPVLPPFDIMMQRSLLDSNVFSFFLGTCKSGEEQCEGSQLTLGGIDENKFTGDITYVHETKYQPKLGYWLVEATGFKVAGSSAACTNKLVGCPMVVDTGTSILTVPPLEWRKIKTLIGAVNADFANVAIHLCWQGVSSGARLLCAARIRWERWCSVSAWHSGYVHWNPRDVDPWRSILEEVLHGFRSRCRPGWLCSCSAAHSSCVSGGSLGSTYLVC